MGKKIGSIFLIVLIAIFAIFGYRYISYRTDNAVSDAAFIKSDRLSILSFKVGGKVVKMNYKESEPVKNGDLLSVMDDTDFKLTKEKLEHTINSINYKIEALNLQKGRVAKMLNLQKDISLTDVKVVGKKVVATQSQIDAKLAEYKKVEADRERYAKLLKQNLIAKGDYEKIATKAKALKDAINAMRANSGSVSLTKDKAKYGVKISQAKLEQIAELQKSIDALQEQKKALEASLKAIDKKISYAKIYAPFSGEIAKKFFDAPRVVGKGSPVYALVDPKALYCEVLLSEKKLKGVKVGNSVKVTVDALKKDFKGKVSSIAPTSASTFSLVPRDIASGEFTKLDQRFVVKIKLENIDGLRAGMGATVAISKK